MVGIITILNRIKSFSLIKKIIPIHEKLHCFYSQEKMLSFHIFFIKELLPSFIKECFDFFLSFFIEEYLAFLPSSSKNIPWFFLKEFLVFLLSSK